MKHFSNQAFVHSYTHCLKVKNNKRILIAPLDWGLGHATRCIPIIRELIHSGDDVLIAGDGDTLLLLKKEFPELTCILLRGYNIHYSSFFPLSISIFFQIPKILWRIYREHSHLKKIINEYQIDAVISDNRYGLWNSKIESVFITHQVMIKTPGYIRFLEPVLYRISKFFIVKYNECWIPDDGQKLSGDLSHRFPLLENSKLIGTLSRWKGDEKKETKNKYNVIGIVSGPEPHRTSFEKLLTEQFRESNLNAIIIQGKPDETTDIQITDRLRLISHLDSKNLYDTIMLSDTIICRAGYSGIMDLTAIGKNAVLIPTPGQTEQVYLAKYLKEKKMFFSVDQKKFHLNDSMNELSNYQVRHESTNHLKKTISSWRKKISESG